MKKYLSILFTALLAATFVFSTTSCSKDDDGSADAKIIGTWEAISASGPFMGEEDGNSYLQFKEDGTYIEVDIEGNDIDIIRGKWSLSDNTLSLSDALVSEGETYQTTVTVSNLTKNSLTLVWAGGILTINFKRVSDSTIEKYL